MEIPSSPNLPHAPGCYLFKDSKGAIIYVGKAKDLKKRVSSYFAKRQDNPKTAALVRHIASVEFVRVDNEDEAIMLESNLIKQHYPKYNIDLKDNAPQTYALVTNEKFPRILLVRKNRAGKYEGGRGRIYGPFMNSGRQLLLSVRKAFKIRTCNAMPNRACLQYHLGLCDAPCEGKISREEYCAQVDKAEGILSSRKKIDQYLDELGEKMHDASSRQDFEAAMKIRDSMRALEGLASRQKIDRQNERDEDFVVVLAEGGKALAQVWRVVRGVVRERLKYSFDYAEDDPQGGFLLQFYKERAAPRNVIVNKLPDLPFAMEKQLSDARGAPVGIFLAPEKGPRRDLLHLIEKNILAEKAGGADPAVVILQQALALERLPLAIECFDISNLQGTHVVGSMVKFVNAQPKKSEYRKFKIRTVEGQDDFASMREVVFRRYRRLRDEGQPLPDMVLIDGGAGQLHAALDALKALGISLPVFSLAKENEEIYGPEMTMPLRLPKNSEALHVLQRARDEAHRFVITYHRKLRGKKAVGKN